MANNQQNRLDTLIAEFKKTILRSYGVEITVFQKMKDSGDDRPTLEQIHKACICVMNELYPDLRNVKILSVRRRHRNLVMFRKIYCYLGYNLKYTCDSVGKYIERDHSSVIHGKKSVEDMIYINDKQYVEALEKVTKLINKYVGTITEDTTRENNTKSMPATLQYEGEDASQTS